MAKRKKEPKAKISHPKMPKSLLKEEEQILFEADESELPPTDIVVFNELRSCADLMRMYETDQITIKPDFQRDIVWKNPAQTRFVDSLIKELPIPSMCISYDHSRKERLVVDGLQRMATIIKFLDTTEPWKLSSLDDIDGRISGRKNEYIRENHGSLYEAVENLTIPITVLRCDYDKPAHMKYLFLIFHRLNTGGSKLSNQEVRNCIFTGPLNDLLQECVESEPFRHLLGLAEKKSYRFAYEELVLRFFAFTDRYSDYDGKLSSYLNEYMNTNRDPDKSFLQKKEKQFDETVNIIYETITDGAPLPTLGKATIEAILVGIGRSLGKLRRAKRNTINARLKQLLKEPEFQPENLKNALTTKEKMIARLKKSENVFSGK